jgi:hypothetical protein
MVMVGAPVSSSTTVGMPSTGGWSSPSARGSGGSAMLTTSATNTIGVFGSTPSCAEPSAPQASADVRAPTTRDPTGAHWMVLTMPETMLSSSGSDCAVPSVNSVPPTRSPVFAL